MHIRPLHDWVVIKPKEASDMTRGGIVIPDAAKEMPREGEVLAVGKGRYESERDEKGVKREERKFIKTVLTPGDRILYEKYMERKVEVDGEDLVLVREGDVLGQFE